MKIFSISFIIKFFKKKRKVHPIIEPELDVEEQKSDIEELESDNKDEEDEEDEDVSETELQKLNRRVLNNETCSVCCELLETDIVRILACGHYYHEKCIEQWFYIINTCPECRESFDTISYQIS